MTQFAPIERKRQRSLAQDVVERILQQIHTGQFKAGDKLPSEAEIVREHGVSRTVVREAISRLQAAGMVDTLHGVGTFVLKPSTETPFRIDPSHIANTKDVLAILELRMSLETEATGLAAQRRTEQHLQLMRQALTEFEINLEQGGDTVTSDIQFHKQIAHATGNRYFVDVMSHLGNTLLPRARKNTAQLPSDEQAAYLYRVNQEHKQIFDGIARQDVEAARAAMRLHLGNGRERQRRILGERETTPRQSLDLSHVLSLS